MTYEDAKRMMREGILVSETCILCHGPAMFTSLYVPSPEASQQLGAPPGKWRMLLYGLCEECFQMLGTDSAEKIILKQNNIKESRVYRRSSDSPLRPR